MDVQKVCKECGEKKQLGEFVKNKVCRDGRAGKCKQCSNKYSTAWKRKNRIRLAARRREIYAATEGKETKRREVERKKLHPLRVRCQLLRGGMRNRARDKNIKFDSALFTVDYLMKRITQNPNCECCEQKLDIEYKSDGKAKHNSPSMDRVSLEFGYVRSNTAILCWRCNNLKRDASQSELRTIADFMDSWGNDIERMK